MDPIMVQLVLTTAAKPPEDPTFPLIVESVQTTAPPAPDVALRTAKFDAVPKSGAAANAAPASRVAVANRQVASDFLVNNVISNRFNCVSSSQFPTEKVKERSFDSCIRLCPWPASRATAQDFFYLNQALRGAGVCFRR